MYNLNVFTELINNYKIEYTNSVAPDKQDERVLELFDRLAQQTSDKCDEIMCELEKNAFVRECDIGDIMPLHAKVVKLNDVQELLRG